MAERWPEDRLGYSFREPEYFVQAVTHKSRSGSNNERLEFLGDALLDLVIAEALYELKPDADEGYLSRLRSTLVRRETLASIAAGIGLPDQLRLGAGELRSGGHQRKSIRADAFEAVIGAVFLDGGYVAARAVVRELYAERFASLPDAEDLKDPKTVLQEYLQARGAALPEYRLEETAGPPHERSFSVVCELEAPALAIHGTGTSRRRAEQDAAARALKELRGDEPRTP